MSATHDTLTERASVASLGHRGAARLLDSLLVVTIAFPTGVASDFGSVWFAGTLLGSVLWFVVGDMTGATLGKRLVGLRVVDAVTLDNPTAGQAARREVLVVAGAIPFAGPVLAAVGWGAVVASARRDEHGRGWHDRFAGTTVTARSRPPKGS